MGVITVLARSFARIHETNLKKQGVLALVFHDPADYERVRADDEISLAGALELQPGKALSATLHHSDSDQDSIELSHSMNTDQIAWFKAGSALNLLRQRF